MEKRSNYTIDIARFVMAILVIGIHTEPFTANIWLDRCYGILTRQCVPFFFATSGYFFIKNKASIHKAFFRLMLLYVIWSVLYLPLDVAELRGGGCSLILKRYLYEWNAKHYLWFPFIDAFSLLLLHFLHTKLNNKRLLQLSICLLLIGCAISTWSPMFFGKNLNVDAPFYRNMPLFGFPYVAIGCYFARSHSPKKLWLWFLGFVSSIILEAVEALIFVIHFKTNTTYLWISTFPATFFLFGACLTIENKNIIKISDTASLLLRRMSALLYMAQNIFTTLFSDFGYGVKYFFIVLIFTMIFSFLIVSLQKKIKFLKYLF